MPFEPQNGKLEYKEDLKNEIKNIKNINNEAIKGTYISKETAFVDIENILFYNVGAGAFSSIIHNTLIFEGYLGEYKLPLPDIQDISSYSHYVRYELVPIPESFENLQPKSEKYLSMENIRCREITSSLKPEKIWLWIKMSLESGNNPIYKSNNQLSNKLGLEVKIYGPFRSGVNLAGIIKPLFDGIFSSLTPYSGRPDYELISKIAHNTSCDFETIQKMLLPDNISILPAKNIVEIYRENIKWNPDDHRLVAAILKTNTSHLSNDFILEFTLYNVDLM